MEFSNLHAAKRTAAGMARAVQLVGCDEAALRAVMRVESAKRGYDSKGRLVALFEPHRFYKEISGQPDKLSAGVAAGLAYSTWGQKPYPKDSYPRILSAMRIDAEAALRATSWGMPQILGSNCKACGYGTAAEMVSDFLTGEDPQILAMARFIDANGLSGRLRAHDWAGFARGYNGAQYAKGGYDKLLAQAYAIEAKADTEESRAKTGAVVVSAGSAGAAAAHKDGPAGPILLIGGLAIGFLLYKLAKARRTAADAPDAPAAPNAPETAETAPAGLPSLSTDPLAALRAAIARRDAALERKAAAESDLAEALAAVEAESAKAQQTIDAIRSMTSSTGASQ